MNSRLGNYKIVKWYLENSEEKLVQPRILQNKAIINRVSEENSTIGGAYKFSEIYFPRTLSHEVIKGVPPKQESKPITWKTGDPGNK